MCSMQPRRLVDVCIDYVCKSFQYYVEEVNDLTSGSGTSHKFASAVVLPLKVVERMLMRLNELNQIENYGLLLLDHCGVSGGLKRVRLPGCFVTTSHLLSSISDFRYLTDINLGFCHGLPANSRAIERFTTSATQLQSLKLNFIDGDLGFELLPFFTAMIDLDLSGTQLSTRHLEVASKAMHCLESLDVSSTQVTLLDGLKAAESLLSLRSLGLHDLVVSSTSSKTESVGQAQSALVSSLGALKKVTHLDVSYPTFSSSASLNGEVFLNAVLTAPPALTEVDVSDIVPDEILKQELEKSPLLTQLKYVGCISLDYKFVTELQAVAPHLSIGSLHCLPRHAGSVLRSQYLKRLLVMQSFMKEDFCRFLLGQVTDNLILTRVGELSLSALWLFRCHSELFASAIYLAACCVYHYGELPQFASLIHGYLEFILADFNSLPEFQHLCLPLLQQCMSSIRKHSGLSVRVSACLVHAVRNFNSQMTCSEYDILQTLHRIVSWNSFDVRSKVNFSIGTLELLISRLKHWSRKPIKERKLAYKEYAVVVTDILADLTDGVLNSSQHFAKLLSRVDCISSLQLSLDAFSFSDSIVWGILCVLGNMAENPAGRLALLCHPSVIPNGVKHLSTASVGDIIPLAACHLLAVLLQADETQWTDRSHSHKDVCCTLMRTLLSLQLYPDQPRNIGYTSIQPLLTMMRCQHVEVCCFGLWMLASMCRSPQDGHCFACLIEDNCSGLDTVHKVDIPDNVPSVFNDCKTDIMDGCKEWLKRK